MAGKKSNINDFKNRMESPFVGVRIDPKTKRPIKANGKRAKKK